jgi:hypothetical protein
MKQSMQILTSSKTQEWYTPEIYIQVVREVLGSIELDPASCWAANEWIKADRYFTEEDDGLAQEWVAKTVFLNPPYGKAGARSSQDIWARKLEQEYLSGNVKEAILLTKCVPGYAWWERLFRKWLVCFVEHRIEFVKLGEDGKIVSVGKAKAGTNFWYLGRNTLKFRHVFEQLGRCIGQPFGWYPKKVEL